jgi:hypothetical protein
MRTATEGRHPASGPRARRGGGLLPAFALVAVAFAFAFAFGHGEARSAEVLHPVAAFHDGAVAVGHDLGFDGSSLHAFRAQPASRTRATAFAILAVGIVVAPAARRRPVAGLRPAVRAWHPVGSAPGRGPPSARIA